MSFSLVIQFVRVKGGKTHKVYVEQFANGVEGRFSMEQCNLDDVANDTEIVESVLDNEACEHCLPFGA